MLMTTIEDWYRSDRMPHIYCAGCGNGTILNCTLQAATDMGWDIDNTVFVSGIGCSSRASGYTAADSLHTTHGRALAFATGVKAAHPDFNVVVFTGDGDLSAIGGNHFIHACRRNVDMTVICINNMIYGMTGGQGSPCTPQGAFSTTTPYGAAEPAFDLAELAKAAGANYVSRWTTYHVKQLVRSIREGMETPGLSFVEVVSQCPTSFGRRNKMKSPVEMLTYLRDHSILLSKKEQIESDGGSVADDIFPVGVFAKRSRPVMGVRK